MLAYHPGQGLRERQLVWVDREGHEEELAADLRPYRWPRISPDGARVAITIRDSGNEDVWIYDLTRNTPTRLTFDPAAGGGLWTPDGRRVVFRSPRHGGEPNLYWKAADGTGQVERLTRSPNHQFPGSFSPDGKRLAFVEINPKTSYDLHVLSMEGERSSKPLLQTQFNEGQAAISPDGRWMAYTSEETGRREVYVRPFPKVEEGRWQISREGGNAPVWGPRGRELFYRSGDAMMVVRVETEPTFMFGTPEVLFTGSYYTGAGRSYDISPDGQRFLMMKEVEQTDETRTELIIVQNWFKELQRPVPPGK